jgi:hypothetical protein
MKIFTVIALCLICSFGIKAQENQPYVAPDSMLIQLSGVVVSSDSLTQMPFATVFKRKSRTGTNCDY